MNWIKHFQLLSQEKRTNKNEENNSQNEESQIDSINGLFLEWFST